MNDLIKKIGSLDSGNWYTYSKEAGKDILDPSGESTPDIKKVLNYGPEKKSYYAICMAGYHRELITLSLSGRNIIVEFDRDSLDEKIFAGKMYEDFQLPLGVNVDVEKITSKMKDGVLYIELPDLDRGNKTDDSPKKIKIS